jgi:hypothetical protein
MRWNYNGKECLIGLIGLIGHIYLALSLTPKIVL